VSDFHFSNFTEKITFVNCKKIKNQRESSL